MEKSKHIEVLHVPRSRNAPEDALVKLAATLIFLEGESVHVTVEE
jgi:hypothetical protein